MADTVRMLLSPWDDASKGEMLLSYWKELSAGCLAIGGFVRYHSQTVARMNEAWGKAKKTLEDSKKDSTLMTYFPKFIADCEKELSQLEIQVEFAKQRWDEAHTCYTLLRPLGQRIMSARRHLKRLGDLEETVQRSSRQARILETKNLDAPSVHNVQLRPEGAHLFIPGPPSAGSAGQGTSMTPTQYEAFLYRKRAEEEAAARAPPVPGARFEAQYQEGIAQRGPPNRTYTVPVPLQYAHNTGHFPGYGAVAHTPRPNPGVHMAMPGAYPAQYYHAAPESHAYPPGRV